MTKRNRGRPRSYDPETALTAALEAFWDRGFAATSLDDISVATGMNRPSLYAAFGDKRAIYRKAIAQFNSGFLDSLEEALFAGDGLAQDLIGFYQAALPIYRAGERAPLGCPAICTATLEAAADDGVQSALVGALERLDESLCRRLRMAQSAGELDAAADPACLGRLAAALLHSLAIRIRARQPGLDPEDLVRKSVSELLRSG